MITYILNSGLCLLILLLIHRFFLQKESMYHFNRYYLLFSICFSFLIPFFTIEIVEVESVINSGNQPVYSSMITNGDLSQQDLSTSSPIPTFDWQVLIYAIYFFITGLLLFRFVRSIVLIFNNIRKNKVINYKGETLVLLEEECLPYSFLKYIFVSKSDFENGRFSDPILKHEVTHVRECHSIDNIFVELLLVFLWFHPGLYWARNSIKLNHEFLADQAALKSVTIQEYKNTLLSMILPDHGLQMTSNLKFSLTNKRLNMMKYKTANTTKLIKTVALIPVFGVMVYLFSEKVPAQIDIPKSRTIVFNSGVKDTGKSDLLITLDPDGKIVIDGETIQKEKAEDVLTGILTSNELSIVSLNVEKGAPMGYVSDVQKLLYENGVSHIEVNSVENRNMVLNATQDKDKSVFYKDVTFKVIGKDGTESEKRYEELTEKQKTRLMPPLKVPEKKTPSEDVFSQWKDQEKYAVWLDGKYTPAEYLKEIYRIHIVYFVKSYVHLNARSVKFPQEHQVSIYTEEGFENAFGEDSGFLQPKKWTITLKEEG